MSRIDWLTVTLYLVIVIIGISSIYQATYTEQSKFLFDFSTLAGKQVVWTAIAFAIGFIIIFINIDTIRVAPLIMYAFSLLMLVVTLIIGKKVNGSTSWIEIGPFALQTSEIAKFATAMTIAYFINIDAIERGGRINMLKIFVVLFIPIILVLLQGDVGTALMFACLTWILYRFGLNPKLLILVFGVILIFFIQIMGLLNFVVYISLLLSLLLFDGSFKLKNFPTRSIIVITSAFIIGSIINQALAKDIVLLPSFLMLGSWIILIATTMLKRQVLGMLMVALTAIGFFAYSQGCAYIFDNVLKEHHRSRIKIVLGMESDPLGTGYNLNQSMIAIGSGGFSGKGFLKGTQAKYEFVPARSTDFIFCTIGEEWGFMGVLMFIAIFVMLVARILYLAERQDSMFAKAFIYCAATFLFFHFFINLAMTMGIFPVIGIPLPFISYGGSSLINFTILVFLSVKLDIHRKATTD
ncbi:MAG: rod shape-determining protein RodA [Bacteroidales bacterium]